MFFHSIVNQPNLHEVLEKSSKKDFVSSLTRRALRILRLGHDLNVPFKPISEDLTFSSEERFRGYSSIRFKGENYNIVNGKIMDHYNIIVGEIDCTGIYRLEYLGFVENGEVFLADLQEHVGVYKENISERVIFAKEGLEAIPCETYNLIDLNNSADLMIKKDGFIRFMDYAESDDPIIGRLIGENICSRERVAFNDKYGAVYELDNKRYSSKPYKQIGALKVNSI